MSYASPTNNFDFESLFLEEEQEVPLNFYQSPTESLLSTSSSGTDHTNSSNEQQQQITYDVISDGYVFGNDFDMNAQKQKGLKQEDLAAANPFYNQTNTPNANNQFSSLNPLNNFMYNQNQKPGFMGYQNPQLMGQLGMYFPHTFPNVFPQFGNQPFPFPNNNLIYTSPNTSPIGLATSPNSNNSNGVTPSSNTSNSTTATTTSAATTQPAESKTKASRRKSAKKNTKSTTTTATTTTTTSSTTSKNEETTTTTSPSTTTSDEQKSTKASTPEPTDSDNSNQSSEKEEIDSSSSSSEKKSEEKKRKRKSKKDGKDGKALTPEEEKELKRQRRLIKNRESAQASRERKKIYIQGLEKKVDGLAQEFNELQGHVVSLEEENEILRQRLKMLGEHVEEPSNKKRKMAPMTSSGQMKVPIPMDSRSFANPFMLDFWSLFGMQQQLQQTQQAAPDMAQLNPRAASSSRRVVMFIMLFCVAMFLVLPHSSDIKFDSQTTTTTTTEQTESVTSRLSPASRKLASTDQKDTMVDVSIDASQKPFVDEDFKKNVAEIYQTFQQVRSEASENSEESEKPTIDDLASRINVVFDTDKISLSFPKSILVKKEEESDEMVDEEQFSNSTYDEKMSSLSTKLLKEICRVVNH
ncbi:basic leucine zipper domain-containing protein [Naegleria gruberi]|uniref:Basic leucine zipper domain-containing protein n=1 Tax=Naegleria gruberi TaxID=5762 RepID=D2V531_NAEGR|nr:basic leucine zipper domain-containing protein [Naegleria gruberi]EFC48037.1 basic leucine zipper domain-containing protein [Naegleria gruberi]|eukprot:XP_002680781.1 basic leucine zipper domain-containing protein [Naegleria gruberi strain NEG-M]